MKAPQRKDGKLVLSWGRVFSLGLWPFLMVLYGFPVFMITFIRLFFYPEESAWALLLPGTLLIVGLATLFKLEKERHLLTLK
ncbi:MAG: hypothetical protein HKN32_04965, partial [Flavobacteriales bacterium]|nr:hypothetical protein [Flavobacteriales bacterium]